jgi:hypothetical protein
MKRLLYLLPILLMLTWCNNKIEKDIHQEWCNQLAEYEYKLYKALHSEIVEKGNAYKRFATDK